MYNIRLFYLIGVGNDDNFISPSNFHILLYYVVYCVTVVLCDCGMLLLCFVQFTKKAGLSGPTRWSEEEIQIALEGSSATS